MISVLMCTYNREQFLRRAIDSVLNQTYTDFEFIIIDDGSTDHTEELVKSYEDERIHYLKMERNSYYCYAANQGFTYCKGKYLAFMNSDDVWSPEKLEKQFKFLEEHTEYGACFTDVTFIDDLGNDITEECKYMGELFTRDFGSQKAYMQFFLKNGNALCHPSAVVKKDVLDKIGGYNLMFYQLADYEMWIRMVMETPIYVLPEKLIKFRWSKDSEEQISVGSADKLRRHFNEQILIRKYLIERLSDEKFIEFFGDWFRNRESRTHLELEFEKAFILLECMNEAPELKVLGMEKMEQTLRIPGAVEVLRNHFQMDIFDIYQWTKEPMYYDPWIERELQELRVKKEYQGTLIGYKDQHIMNLEDKISNLEENIIQKDQHITNLDQYMNTLNQKIDHLEENIEQKDQHIVNLDQHIRMQEEAVVLKDEHVKNLDQNISELREELKRKDQQVMNLNQHIGIQEEAIVLKDQHIDNLGQNINQLNEVIIQKNQYVTNLEHHNCKLTQHVQYLEEQVKMKDQLIDTYENSTSWKVTKPLRDFMRIVKNGEN